MWRAKQRRVCRKCTPRSHRDDVVVANDVLLEAHKEDVAITNGREWDGVPLDGATVDVKEKLG